MTQGTSQSMGWTEIPGHGDIPRFNRRAPRANDLEWQESTVAFDEYDGPSYAEGLCPNPVA